MTAALLHRTSVRPALDQPVGGWVCQNRDHEIGPATRARFDELCADRILEDDGRIYRAGYVALYSTYRRPLAPPGY